MSRRKQILQNSLAKKERRRDELQEFKRVALLVQLKYDTLKKWKQRKRIILDKNNQLYDQNLTNISFLATKGIYTQNEQQASEAQQKPQPGIAEGSGNSQILAGYNSELDELLALPRDKLDKILVASKVSEVQAKIQRLVHLLGVDKGNYIERKRAKEILIEGLQAVVMPLVNFGASPLAQRLEEIYLSKIPKEQKRQKVSELMSEYARSFEETLIRCERKLDKA